MSKNNAITIFLNQKIICDDYAAKTIFKHLFWKKVLGFQNMTFFKNVKNPKPNLLFEKFL